MTISGIFLVIGLVFSTLFFILLAYFLLNLVGALIPVHRDFKPSNDGVPLYLHSNGLHTRFLLPAKNAIFDWTRFVDARLFETDLRSSAFLSFGWGDKAIYLEVPEWNQLTWKLAWRTLLVPSAALLHVEAHQNPSEKTTVPVRLTAEQYARLCQFIFNTFTLDAEKKVQWIEGAGYTPDDHFFYAEGKYHAFNTCNTWVNEGLKQVGVRTALWASIDKGLFYQLKKIRVAGSEAALENQPQW